MSLHEVAQLLGGDVSGGSVLAPGLGHSPKDRSMSVKFSPTHPDGFLVNSFAGDPWPACRDHVRSALHLREWRHPYRQSTSRRSLQRPREASDPDAGDKLRYALQIWHEASDPRDTPVIAYLERARKIIELPPDVHEALRFHPWCRFGDSTHPCLVALLRDAITDEPTGIHRIALTSASKLIGRKALGRKKGCAIKLWPDAEVSAGLVIGEGLESVLAAAVGVTHHGTFLRPAWACVDASNLEAFPVINGIEYLTVLADNDVSGVGQAAARACARCWADAGREAEVLIPSTAGHDFNDVAVQS
jgi:hypothetical protein